MAAKDRRAAWHAVVTEQARALIDDAYGHSAVDDVAVAFDVLDKAASGHDNSRGSRLWWRVRGRLPKSAAPPRWDAGLAPARPLDSPEVLDLIIDRAASTDVTTRGLPSGWRLSAETCAAYGSATPVRVALSRLEEVVDPGASHAWLLQLHPTLGLAPIDLLATGDGGFATVMAQIERDFSHLRDSA